MNIFDPDQFTSPDCMPCCVTGCDLTMPTILIDGTTTNYANITAATAAIAAQAVNCLLEVMDNTIGVISAAIVGVQLVITDAISSGSLSRSYLAEVTLAGAGNIKIDYVIATDAGNYGIGVVIYQADGTTVEGSDAAGFTPAGTLTVACASTGPYFVFVSYNEAPSGSPGTFLNVTTTDYSDVDVTFCTIRAAYDDGSGGTAYVICT